MSFRLIVESKKMPAGDHYFLVTGICPSADWDALGSMLEHCVLSFSIL